MLRFTLSILCLTASVFVNAQLPPGALLHLKADSINEAFGASIANWPDISGNDLITASVAGFQQPKFILNTTLNRSTVVFDGNSDLLVTNLQQSFPQPSTVFILWNINSATNVQIPFASWPNLNALLHSSGDLYLNGGSFQPYYTKTIPFNFILSTCVFNGANSQLYENSVLKNTLNSGGNSLGNDIEIGGLRAQASGFPTIPGWLNGAIAEIIIYNGVLNPTDRLAVENYLAGYYSTPLSLGPDINTCSPEEILAVNPNNTYSSILWSNGQTNTNSISVSENGWHWVEVNSFGLTIRDSIFVEGLVAKPSLNVLNDTVICAGSVFNLNVQNVQPGVTYTWNEGSLGATLPISGSSSFWVTADNGQGCSFTSDTLDFILDYFPLQQGLGEDRVFCLNTDLYFDYGSDGFAPYDHVWSTGSTNTFITPTNLGFETFSVVVTDALGCEAEDTVTIELVNTIGPTVNFSFDTVCPFTINNFVNQSQLAAGDILSNVQWNFPTNTLIGNSVNYTFPQNQPYIVELIIGTVEGCSGVKRDTVTFLPKPDVYFVLGDFCQEVSGSLLASQLSPESIVSWQWNFGDPASGVNNTAAGSSVSHVFNLAGNYNVQLIATDFNGCTDTTVQVVNVKAAPSADFNFIEACAGSFISFENSTTIPSPFVVSSYSWQFGDGSTSGQTNPSKPYLNAGNYSVTLTANGNNGCSNAITKTVKVHAFPQPNYIADLNCAGSPIFVADNSFVQNGSVATVTWSFNGSTPVSGFESSYTFETVGTQTIEQTVFSAFGCETSVEHTITLTGYLFADFTAIPGAILAGYPMTFQNNSVGQDTTVWIVNGTDTVSTTNLTWTFPASALGTTVEITFIVANEDGCSDTIVRTYPVLENRTDLAVNQLFAQKLDGFYIVGVELENRGSTPIIGADLFLRSTNTPVIKETWTGLLEAGDKEIYVFSAQLPATVSAEDTLKNYICVTANLTFPAGFGDEDLTNNENCYTNEVNESVLLIPYPNPTSSLFNLRVILPEDAATTIQIYDVAGRLVSTVTENAPLSEGLTTFSIDASSWSDGIYSIVLVSGKERKIGKIQVLHRD